MKILILSLTLFSKCFLIAASSYGTFTPPQGWEILDPQTLPPTISFMARAKPKNLFSSTINLAVEETDLSLDDYMKEVEKIYQEPSKFISPLGTLQTAAGPMKVLQIDEKLPWSDLRIIQGVVIKDHIAYVITATTEESEFSSLVTSLLKSMKSFSIVSPKRAP